MDKIWLVELEKIYRQAPISKTLNSDIHFDEEGRAHFVLRFNAGVCHGFGDVHGGIIATMIDIMPCGLLWLHSIRGCGLPRRSFTLIW